MAAAGLTAAGLAAAPAAPAGAAPGGLPGVAALQWGPCPDVVEPSQGLQCAKLKVPLDYTRPQGRKIEIAVSRLASTEPRRRRGVLLLDPGGTNRSELGLPLLLESLGLPAGVRERYDLIGFDPRGIGLSTPVTCDLRDGQELNIPPSPWARDSADVARRAEELRTIAAQCGGSATGDLLPYMSTANVARDMDGIRRALGEQRISYLGYSYGTYLGAVYATLFPQRTDRIVLDSVVGTGGLDHTWSRRLARGVEDTFPDFARWAADRHGVYGLGSTPQQVREKFFELAGRLDREPVGGMDGPDFRYTTFSSLFSPAVYPSLAETWQAVDRAVTDPRAGVTVPQAEEEVMDFSGLIHLSCSDSSWRRDVAYYQRAVERDRIRFPMFGASGANIWPCAFWPSRPLERPVRIGDRGPSNILMVSNLRDPGTPYVGATEMRRALGGRARFVTVDGSGHLVYLFQGNRCVDDLVTGFLVDGRRPPADRSCEGVPAG